MEGQHAGVPTRAEREWFIYHDLSGSENSETVGGLLALVRPT
jgi:hypothetical protein